MGGRFHREVAHPSCLGKESKKMIEITAAVHHDKIIELLSNYNEDGIQFSFKEKNGLNLYFETNSENLEKASRLAKTAIKKQPWGSVLYFLSSPAK